MERKKLKYPIGVQSFESLRNNDFVYVDKTMHLYNLVNEGKYYFLSRPRRFGKSLFLSTLQAYFEGKKDLFKDTFIATKEEGWLEYPVLKLDLNTEDYTSVDVLRQKLDLNLKVWEAMYPTGYEEYSLGNRFEQVIKSAATKCGRGVVILVDEYDKPLLQAIGNNELQDAFRGVLKGFYGAVKSMDSYIKFAFLTGVTKFGKVSVFSDLNNLNDISMDARYWDICGLSKKELGDNFHLEINTLAEANNMSYEECLDVLRLKYDGYHFHPSALGMYNPFSVLKTFDKKEFGSYWFETGTPTYLVELLKGSDYNLEELSSVKTDADTLNNIDSASSEPISVIYQSGYLTIKGYDSEFGMYTLGFPNKEVEDGFLRFLMPYYTSATKANTAFNIQQFVKDVRAGNTEQFLKRLKSLFADTPYELIKDLENHYQNVIWLVSKLMGFYVQAEYHTSEGRIDLVLKTDKFCYVMEFKLDGTAEEALAQIKDRNYTMPFEMNSQTIIRIGLNFDSNTRNIERYIIE